MKQKILMAALAEVSLAMIIGISILFIEMDGTLGLKLYTMCTILGVTGFCTGLVGAVFPKEEK